MKFFKRAIAGVASIAMLACLIPSSSLQGTTKATAASAIDHWNDDWLHVEGNKILDMNNNEVWLTGVNWFGFNCTENILHGWWASVEVTDMIAGIADRGFNIIRVPVSTELLVSWMNGTPLEAQGVTAYDDTMGGGVNKDLVPIKKNSLALFEYFMTKCKENGLKVMIDIHSAESDNSGHDKPLWYHGKFDTDDWMDSLVWLADKYKNDDTLLAYDLKNEPHGKANDAARAKWDDSTDKDNWRYAAETCGRKILEVNPNALILVEGVEVYPVKGHTYAEPPIGYPVITNYHGAWWGGNLRGVKDYPITLKSPLTGHSQLVYSPHEYGPSVYAQPWFDKDFTLQTLLDDYMYDTWAYLLPDYPLLIGEWGGHMDGGINQKWMTILRDYMVDNKIHHTFWCYNPNSGDTGGLIGNDWKTWDEEKYGLVEPSLWQTEDGKYIGLDHQVPLGKNGITVSEYYGSEVVVPPVQDIVGDINGDKKVNIADLVVAKRYVLGNYKNSNAKKGDVNKDGKVDVFDINLYIKYLLGKIDSFPQ